MKPPVAVCDSRFQKARTGAPGLPLRPFGLVQVEWRSLHVGRTTADHLGDNTNDDRLVRAVEFLADQGENVCRCVLTEEDIQVAVVGKHVERMITFAPRIEELESALLALGQEAVVVNAGEEREAGGGAGLAGNEVR